MKPRSLRKLAGAASIVALPYGAGSCEVPSEAVDVTTVAGDSSAHPEVANPPSDAPYQELQRHIDEGIVIIGVGIVALYGTAGALRRTNNKPSSPTPGQATN